MKGQFVITGGPGTGKSTLIKSLREAGLACFDEVSREVIVEANKFGTGLLPWENLQLFADECFRRMKEQLGQVQSYELCFFDRGIPDIAAYLKNGGLTASSELLAMGNRYAKLALVAPPWKEIFVNDSERPQSFNDCIKLHTHIVETYLELGYKVVMIPRLPVDERVWFVLKTVEEYLLESRTVLNTQNSSFYLTKEGSEEISE